MSEILIVGSGMAGLGASYRLRQAGVEPVILDKNAYVGGHTASFRHAGGWIFDDGPHISFTKNGRMRDLFAESVGGEHRIIEARVNNFWKGHWIKHPAQCNLHGLPTELVVAILKEFSELPQRPISEPQNYEEWLVAGYGRTFAEEFPIRYGLKYHTTNARNMTTDWLGPRLYRPSFEEVLRGALSPSTSDVHYIDQFRYPTHGGFVSYLKMFLKRADVRLGHSVRRIDVKAGVVECANGSSFHFQSLISSIPLPALLKLVSDVPLEVSEAAAKLAWTKAVIVNLGVARADISQAHWTYFYDEDYVFTRLNFPHMLSPNTVPDGMGSIQAEIYFSDKYRPVSDDPENYIPRVVEDLKRCGLLSDEDRIPFSEAYISPWCQIIYDHERAKALSTVQGFLKEVGIEACGRYGEWGYLWTDESFMSGERAADSCLSRM